MLRLPESIGQTYELGSLHQYTSKELMEYLSNVMNHRPRYISYSYEDFMKLHLSPNWNFEKAVNWLIARPDFLAEMRTDIVVNKRNNIKTFEDLFITPVAPHSTLKDMGQYLVDRLVPERFYRRNFDELDADDDGHI